MHLTIARVWGAVVFFCVAFSAAAEDEKHYRAIDALLSLGFKTCANNASAVTKFLYDEDDFAYLNTWNQTDADKHTALTLTTKTYSDGASFATVATTPTPDGACDASFSQIFVLSESCAKLRDTTFKEWKFYGDLGGTPLYEDPTSDSVVVGLATIQSNCLVIKTGVFFFPPPAKEAASE